MFTSNFMMLFLRRRYVANPELFKIKKQRRHSTTRNLLVTPHSQETNATIKV